MDRAIGLRPLLPELVFLRVQPAEGSGAGRSRLGVRLLVPQLADERGEDLSRLDELATGQAGSPRQVGAEVAGRGHHVELLPNQARQRLLLTLAIEACVKSVRPGDVGSQSSSGVAGRS
jgi:hypothetical protein